MCFALYISFLDIYKLKQNPWVLSKWISHLSFVRRHSPTEASDQSSFLPSEQQHYCISFTTIIFTFVFIKQQLKSWRQKQFRRPSKLSQALIVVFVFLLLSKSRNLPLSAFKAQTQFNYCSTGNDGNYKKSWLLSPTLTY